MPGSRTSVFGEAEDFEAVLSADGVAAMLFLGHGQFRARLTQVRLERLRLATVEETQLRVAFIAVSASMVLVACPINGGPSPVWGGLEIRRGEIITLGPGQRLHTKTGGPCQWGYILVPYRQVVEYGRALSGPRFVVPTAARWRPPPAPMRQLRELHRSAIRMAEAVADVQAAHGLEQQILDALIECLSEGAQEETAAGRRRRDILARFEDLLVAEPSLPVADVCAALGVSDRLLRECCKSQLGMGPSRYRRLRAMQQLHRALRSGTPDIASVSEAARQHGFNGLGRLAANYRVLYGELPSATLRRGSGDGLASLTSRLARNRL
jgi:AraC-like DNA-binding protein